MKTRAKTSIKNDKRCKVGAEKKNENYGDLELTLSQKKTTTV